MSFLGLAMSDGEFDRALTQGESDQGHTNAERTALTIRTVSRMFHVSPLRLRFYEWRGLIRRARRGRTYAYSWIDCERVALITKARKVGLGLRHIEPVIRAMDTSAPRGDTESGRERCAALIQLLDTQQRIYGDALSELRRIERELVSRSKPALR